jgi:pimeloyl-ACP methyl ester carboxylesterase
MGEYVDLPGVKTWYETEGSGDPLLLLHGGLCTNETWAPQRAEFASSYKVFLPERRAHGHTPDVDGPLHYQDMAQDTIDFIETVVGQPAHLVGWSDGADVGLLVAIARPDLVRKLVLIGSNHLPPPEIPGAPNPADSLDPDNPGLAMFRGMYEAASPDGPEHWPVVLPKLAAMWSNEPRIPLEDLGRITAQTLVFAGDDDLVSLEHTIEQHRAIPGSELAIVPGTSHAVLMEKTELANRIILDFLVNDPVPTMMPIRRATASAH